MKLFVYKNDKRIKKDRRERNEFSISGADRRENENDRRTDLGVGIDYIDTLLEQMRWDFIKSMEYFKDKERKKLLIVSSSFGVIAIIISVLIGSSSSAFGIVTTATEGKNPTFGLFTIVAIIAIAAINLVITKYIISLKGECLNAVRQVNCLRQGIHALLYFKLHGKYPENSDNIKQGIFGEIYGKHKKFDIDNVKIRKRYESLAIFYLSADLLAVSVLGILSMSLASYPAVQAYLTGAEFTMVHFVSVIVTSLLASVILLETGLSTAKINRSLSSDKNRDDDYSFELIAVP